MLKVLIITYYWPPAGGSGVQRWLKMVKYISQTNWEPIVYTALNPEAPIFDGSLGKDVPGGIKIIRRRVFEPYRFFRFMTRQRGNMAAGFTSKKLNKASWLTQLAIWIRGNCFIPDARFFWIEPSSQFLIKYLRNNPVDVIITTGPPHSMHLIGLKLKQTMGVKWIADFRDPWANIDYAADLMLLNRSIRKHQLLEQQVVQSADAVVVVSKQMQKEFELLNPRFISCIPNGFDEEDFILPSSPVDEMLSITHIGTIPGNRNCPNLWRAISNRVATDPEFSRKLVLRFIGEVDGSVMQSLQEARLMPYCRFLGYLPHAQAVEQMLQSQVLLLLVNNSRNANGILTGKLYEYMAARRPILALGPKNGDLDLILSQTGAGKLVDFDNANDIEIGLEWVWQHHKSSFQHFQTMGIGLYTRKNLSLQMVRLMEQLTIR